MLLRVGKKIGLARLEPRLVVGLEIAQLQLLPLIVLHDADIAALGGRRFDAFVRKIPLALRDGALHQLQPLGGGVQLRLAQAVLPQRDLQRLRVQRLDLLRHAAAHRLHVVKPNHVVDLSPVGGHQITERRIIVKALDAEHLRRFVVGHLKAEISVVAVDVPADKVQRLQIGDLLEAALAVSQRVVPIQHGAFRAGVVGVLASGVRHEGALDQLALFIHAAHRLRAAQHAGHAQQLRRGAHGGVALVDARVVPHAGELIHLRRNADTGKRFAERLQNDHLVLFQLLLLRDGQPALGQHFAHQHVRVAVAQHGVGKLRGHALDDLLPVCRVEARAPRVHVQKPVEHRTHELRLFALGERLGAFQQAVIRLHRVRFQIAALGQIALDGLSLAVDKAQRDALGQRAALPLDAGVLEVDRAHPRHFHERRQGAQGLFDRHLPDAGVRLAVFFLVALLDLLHRGRFFQVLLILAQRVHILRQNAGDLPQDAGDRRLRLIRPLLRGDLLQIRFSRLGSVLIGGHDLRHSRLVEQSHAVSGHAEILAHRPLERGDLLAISVVLIAKSLRDRFRLQPLIQSCKNVSLLIRHG